MRIHTILMSFGVGLLAVTVTACSTGAKTSSSPTTSIAAATTTAPPATAPSTTVAASSATSSSTSAPAAGGVATDVNACTLLSTAKASTLTGAHFTAAKSSTIASGQDQCNYTGSPVSGPTVIVYQPTSGVSWTMVNSVLTSVGDTKTLTGVGDLTHRPFDAPRR